MGYETSRVRKGRGKGKTLATMPVESSKNKAVAKVYRKAAEAPKTKVEENKHAVLTLARQVRSLQLSSYGLVQNRAQECAIASATLQSNTPLAFLVNAMYNNEGVYAGNLTTGTPGFTQVGTFNKYDFLTDIGEQYQWNARQSLDTVSQATYKPIFTRVNMSLNVKYAGPSPLGRVRVTYFKLKNPHLSSDKVNVNLPQTLGAYRNMAINAAQQTRNSFSSRFHTILYDKWVVFPNPCRTADEKANVNRRLSIPFKYKDSDILSPDYDQHPPAQDFWTNIPIADQVWCLISCNVEMDTALFSLHMDRKDSWRDKHGVGG